MTSTIQNVDLDSWRSFERLIVNSTLPADVMCACGYARYGPMISALTNRSEFARIRVRSEFVCSRE